MRKSRAFLPDGESMHIVFRSGGRSRVALLLVLSLALAACGSKTAPDLLGVAPSAKPTSASGYQTVVTINPRINNFEGIDQSVHDSLDMALDSAKIFSPNAPSKYKITADVLTASQAAWSVGSFEGKLEIHYSVADPSGRPVADKTIYTEAGSDQFSLLGAARSRRSRAVNIAKNVTQFVEFLQTGVALP